MIIGLERDIITLRKDGLSCRETAERLGIKEYRVWRCMSKYGLAGQLRCKHNRVNPDRTTPVAALRKALDDHDVVVIERGAAGGYIVTIDDKTGVECETIPRAVRAAL